VRTERRIGAHLDRRFVGLANGHICQFWRWHHYFMDRTWHRPAEPLAARLR
jgi:hypothetical protein